VVTVREGLNLPRYPSLPGRLRAKKKAVERIRPERRGGGLEKVRLRTPVERGSLVEILGRGPEAAPRVVEVLRGLGLL
jgi:electron transfer flavoprotein beta subunit